MKWPYVIAVYLAALFIFGWCSYTRVKKQDAIAKPVGQLLFCAGLALSFYATAIYMPVRLISDFAFSIYNCCIDAMVFSLLLFVRSYTGLESKRRKEKMIVFGAMLLDWIFMLLNPFFEWGYQTAVARDRYGYAYSHIADREILNVYHLAFVYLTMMLLLAVLIRKVVGSPKIYKVKYVTVLISLCIVLVLHVTYLNFNFAFDYSLFFYVVIAFSVFYFSLLFVPKGLMESLLFFSISHMQDGIVCVDIDGKCVHVNVAAKTYCRDESDGIDKEKLVQQWFREHPDAEKKDFTWESTRTVNGEICYFVNEYKRIFDDQQRYLGCFFILHDRTAEHKRLADEQYRATHDSLTGMFNQEHFYEVAEQMIHANPDKQFVIIGTDIKNFKLVNDLFGVEMGDAVLKRAAEIIAGLATQYTVFGRITGDRFAILMLEERLREEVFLNESAKLSDVLNHTIFRFHVHFGVYYVTDPNVKVSIMCDRAFLAIRTIKDSYENTVAYYDKSMRDSFVSEHKVISEFEQAIQEGQFRAFIQPQISVDGSIRGGEALVRWLHPEEGLVPPYKFISIFERTGLISRLDPYIWDIACGKIRQWQDAGYKHHYISVNISPKDFLLIDVYEILTALVKKHDIPPENLHLEITETSVMNNPKEQLPLINKLRQFGFIVEIDDFGSGYSSLNTLKDLRADVLKIDMGFLSKTEYVDRSLTILKMIISLAKSLNMEVITEGVETREQVDFLTEFGCDVFQGYYFAKPMQVSDFELQYLKS